MSCVCLVDMIAQAINDKYGPDRSGAFLTRFKDWNNGVVSLLDYPEAVQVRILDKYWRMVLCDIEGTLHVRLWLGVDATPIDYVTDFRNIWMTEAAGVGAL